MLSVFDKNKEFERSHLLNWVAFLLPSIFYLGIVLYHVKNVPVWDEFGVVLNYLCIYQQEGVSFLWENLTVWKGYNYGFIHTLTLLQYSLLGKVNFSFMILIGNLNLVLFFYLVHRFVLREFKVWLTLIFGFWLLQFSYWEMTFFSLSSTQGFGTICLYFLILILYLSLKDQFKWKYWVIGALTFVLIYSTMRNGILILPALIYLAWMKKDRKFLWSLIGITLVLGLIYLYIYSAHSQMRTEATSTLYKIKFVLILLSDALLQNGDTKNFLLGTFILAGILWAFWFNYRKDDRASRLVNTLFILCIGSQCMIAVFRSRFGLGFAQQSRYCIFSVIQITMIAFTMYRTDIIKMRIPKISMLVLLIGAGFIQYNSLKNGFNRFEPWQHANVNGIVSYVNDPDLKEFKKSYGKFDNRFEELLNCTKQGGFYEFEDKIVKSTSHTE